jgi:pimeloyl-ACP methyl ester carboxylesterase
MAARPAALLRLLPLALLLPIGAPARPPAPPAFRAERLEAGGVHVRALRAGEAETTVVFLHGYAESLVSWRPVLDRVAPGHRVLALDLPGFGLSDKPAGPYDVRAQAARLRPLLAAEGRPLVLVGHSMGGAVALALAADGTLPVAAVALVAPAGFGLSEAATPLQASGAASLLAAVAPLALPVHAPDWLAEPETAMAYEPALDPAYHRAARAALRDVEFGALDALARDVRAPVLLVWGRLDPTTPHAGSTRLLASLPCARLASLDRAFHRPHQAQADTVAALLLDFLGDPRCDG